MSKRMTDTEKWKKRFIRSLPTKYKILWFFITDDCDHAGIWHVDIDAAQLYTGEKLKIEDAIQYLGKKIHIFDNGQKWYIPSFIDFQYGELKETNNVHLSVISRLKKYNLLEISTSDLDEIEGLASPLQGAKDKEQDKDKDKAKDKDKEKAIPEKLRYGEHVQLTQDEYTKLVTYFGTEQQAKQSIENLDDYLVLKPKYRNEHKDHHYTIIQTWDRKDKREGRGRYASTPGLTIFGKTGNRHGNGNAGNDAVGIKGPPGKYDHLG